MINLVTYNEEEQYYRWQKSRRYYGAMKPHGELYTTETAGTKREMHPIDIISSRHFLRDVKCRTIHEL